MTGGAAPEMPCAELVEVVTDAFEGRMGAADQARFDEHLAGCPDCLEYVAQIRRTVDAIGRLRVEELILHSRA